MRKIRKYDAILSDLAGELPHLLMRPLEELFEQAKVGHDLERGGMDRVAAKIAEDVRMFLKHHHLYAGTGEQIPKHHAGGSASGDAATSGGDLGRHRSDSTIVSVNCSYPPWPRGDVTNRGSGGCGHSADSRGPRRRSAC